MSNDGHAQSFSSLSHCTSFINRDGLIVTFAGFPLKKFQISKNAENKQMNEGKIENDRHHQRTKSKLVMSNDANVKLTTVKLSEGKTKSAIEALKLSL